jgi:hypothetical protein
MGNWRTVHITGTCNRDDLPDLRALVTEPDYMAPEYDHWYRLHYEDVGCLSFSATSPSLAGLNNWPAERIDIIGNLHERDLSVQDVEDAVAACLKVAPSLRLLVDCGGDYESSECVATVAVDEDGSQVRTLPPRVETLPEIPQGQMMAALMKQLRR